MWNAIISLFSITVGLYQGDYREIQSPSVDEKNLGEEGKLHRGNIGIPLLISFGIICTWNLFNINFVGFDLKEGPTPISIYIYQKQS